MIMPNCFSNNTILKNQLILMSKPVKLSAAKKPQSLVVTIIRLW